MEHWLCENCEEYVAIPKGKDGTTCPYCEEWVYNQDFRDDDSDASAEARWVMRKEEPGKYQPQYNEFGEQMYANE